MREAEIESKIQASIQRIQGEIDQVAEIILLCEEDKGDDRYDALHEAKNRLTTAKKKLKSISWKKQWTA